MVSLSLLLVSLLCVAHSIDTPDKLPVGGNGGGKGGKGGKDDKLDCKDAEIYLSDVIISSYVWESSQLLTKYMYSYAVFEGDNYYLDKFYGVLDMRNGVSEYDGDFPLLQGLKMPFDKIFKIIFNDYEYADYELALAASNALVSIEEEAEVLVEQGKYNQALQKLTSNEYFRAKQEIEFYAKSASESLQRRLLLSTRPQYGKKDKKDKRPWIPKSPKDPKKGPKNPKGPGPVAADATTLADPSP